MNQGKKQAGVFEYVQRLADDALILGHRLSEWCSYGPWLEEDLALTNTALDHIGRARLLYDYAADVEGLGRSEDDLAYLRSEREYRNLLVYELPKGNFADTMARQFLTDAYQVDFFNALSESGDEVLSAIAQKSVKECRYHLRRSRHWVIRLGDGTPESHSKMQQALDSVWGYTHELFAPDELDSAMLEAGIGVDITLLKPEWDSKVNEVLAESTLVRPDDEWSVIGGRSGVHTEHLGFLLAELQYMQRSYPALDW
jgi:ring-1,2-phenylacetyl-CoA epoxidase subunit PaaC